jgi:hypothetical protein
MAERPDLERLCDPDEPNSLILRRRAADYIREQTEEIEKAWKACNICEAPWPTHTDRCAYQVTDDAEEIENQSQDSTGRWVPAKPMREPRLWKLWRWLRVGDFRRKQDGGG